MSDRTAAKFINISLLFIPMTGFTLRLVLMLNIEQKADYIFVAPPYCQTACCTPRTKLEEIAFYLFSPMCPPAIGLNVRLVCRDKLIYFTYIICHSPDFTFH